MGKSKKRIFNKNKENISPVIKRQNVVKKIISGIKNNSLTEETKRLIGLFGITSEELTEAGISFEEMSAVKDLFF